MIPASTERIHAPGGSEDAMNILFEAYKPSKVLRGHLRLGGQSPNGERIDVTSLYLERGGRPWIGVMGEYHFSRDRREHWREELAKMKAGGVGIVATYVFWIYHEEQEGRFDFSGDLDLRAFLLECAAQGLDAVIRIGPWAHGECRNGGFPDWLLEKGIPLRTDDPAYLRYARVWYERVFEQVKGLFYRDGGPVIGVQIENELVNDAAHLLTLKRMAQDIGYDVPLWTATGWNSRYGARIPVDDVLPVFAAYAEAPWADDLAPQPLSGHYAFDPIRNDSAVGMDLLRDTDADGWRLPYERYPFAMCELGSGLQSTYHRRVNVSGMDAYAMALVKLGCGNNLLGYYMFHGGTNRIGALSTLQESRATGYPNDLPILNYDFHTCLTKDGRARAQYALLNLLHLFVTDFGERLAAMEHVAARDFVPCTDRTRLRCCLRTDGESGFVFVNHYQRRARLKDVFGARLQVPGAAFPEIDVRGDVAFFFPFHMQLPGALLVWATAQPICRVGDAYVFAQVDGIPAQYRFELPGGEARTVCAQAGLSGGFAIGGARVVTLPWERAVFLRRLDGELFVGEGCNLYALDGELRAIEDGPFAYHRWTGEGFTCEAVNRPFEQAALTIEEVDEPFTPRYMDELRLGGPAPLRWRRLSVSSPQGLVTLGGTYDVAQIYADGELVADHFFDGEPWQVPASLLFGRECYLVATPIREGKCYLEYREVGD